MSRQERRLLHRVVITLAPAELPKQAASFDLPITLSVLAGSGQLASERFEQYAVVGELSLEWRMRPAKGALSTAMSAARQRGLRGLVVPDTYASEAAVVEQLEVIPVSSLAEAAAAFAGHIDIDPVPSRLQELFSTLSHYDDDYSDVRGQELVKRAMVIATAGAHNLLMLGPPGSGKNGYVPRQRTIDSAAAYPGHEHCLTKDDEDLTRRWACSEWRRGVRTTFDEVPPESLPWSVVGEAESTRCPTAFMCRTLDRRLWPKKLSFAYAGGD